MQIISLGMGLQSTALYFMSSTGELPRADYAIFADTGREGSGTYQYLKYLLKWKEQNNGIPVIVCREKNLFDDLLNNSAERRFASIPAYTRNEDGTIGMLRRQCTAEYKIFVVDNCIRDRIYGLSKGSRRPVTRVWHGITLDEQDRMHIPREAWKVNVYPFLGRGVNYQGAVESLEGFHPMNRQEVIRWYLLHGLEVPPKSACVFCPYQSDRAWALKKKYAPQDFADAVRVDEAIRNSTRKGIHHPVYLHRSCRPLADVAFDVKQDEDWAECSGNCHV